MTTNPKKTLLGCLGILFACQLQAQTYTWISSSEGKYCQEQTVKLQKTISTTPEIEVAATDSLSTFRAWGTCFNELGWDALNLLSRKEQGIILSQLFAPDGDLRFTMGRFSINANDYARDWYSCDEVAGDFQLKYFNINRDKTSLIPYIKAAQHYNPNMTFWVSPWSPPSWMKVNHYYSVRSDIKQNEMSPDSDILLFETSTNKDSKVFPQQLAVNDYFIQDPRYLKTYANYFCKFISAYKEQGIPINMVMFQNEAWSYTIYPGCAWTPEGIIRFNVEYLAPALKEHHPEVSLYLGTINTNRYDVIDKVLSDPRMPQTIQGIGFQWEGGQILPRLRKKYPRYKYVQTESECGWGAFDWKAAEHTFRLMNHYLANGCEEYTFWNAILCDDGISGWGWKQNALIRVDSKTKTASYTPEYYAVKHYSHYVIPGSKLIGYQETKKEKKPILIFLTPGNKFVVIAGNLTDQPQKLTLKLGMRYLDVSLAAHSFNTFRMK